MKLEDVKDVISFAEVNGYDAKMGDISYVVLENAFSSKKLAYRTLFNNDGEITDELIEKYNDSEMIQCIKEYMLSNKYILTNSDIDKIKNKNNISAEQNKEGMIKLIATIEEAVKEKAMTKKDGISKLIDLRFKLQSKFDIEDTNNKTHIIIPPSYNAICSFCGHEVTAKTK